MATNKTQPNDLSVEDFISQVRPIQRCEDSKVLLKMMEEVSQHSPKMWSKSLIGFGNTHYKYASGREVEWFLIGFSPRKQNFTLYLTSWGIEAFTEELGRLGKHKIGVGCMYIDKLSDINLSVLEEILLKAVKLNSIH